MGEEKEARPLGDFVRSLLRQVWNFVVRYPVAILVAAVVVVVGYMLVKRGFDVNIGGILGRLFGWDGKRMTTVELANSIPKDRKDSAGNPIPVGVPDEHGYTQLKQREIVKDKSLFRDTSVVKIVGDDGMVEEIQLPVGVKDTDVDAVVEVRPEVHVVKIKDTSGIDGAALKNLLDGAP